MIEQKKIYCFDSSSFIVLNRAHTVIPVHDLWSELDNLFKSGHLISHEVVYEELNPETKNPDFLGKWVRTKQMYFSKTTEKQIELVSQIVKIFPDIIDYDKEKEEADPWVIALAIEKMEGITLFEKNHVTVVTQEKVSSPKKIPAVCKHFKVPHMNLEDFFNDKGWKFGLIKP